MIEDGRAVLCYCAKGRHRSVAMAAAILIAQGCSAAEAMAQLRARRRVAHPQAWHIRRRIEQFERVWQQPVERRAHACRQPEERYSEFATNSLSKLLWSLGLGQNS
jgi:protein-tyrosine phosphatase